MTDQDLRFCPRCGNALVAGEPYCPKCGFHVAALGASSPEGRTEVVAREERPRTGYAPDPSEPRRMGGGPLVLAAVIIAAGLIGYGVLTRPTAPSDPSGPTTTDPSGSPASTVLGASPVASPPIVGMTIQSPRDGEQVSTKEVTVIGLAPPGLRITRDISLRPDQHATADSTGHWAIAVTLDPGENTLVFRIGDDRSTEQRIRVTFTPPAG